MGKVANQISGLEKDIADIRLGLSELGKRIDHLDNYITNQQKMNTEFVKQVKIMKEILGY